MDVSRLMNPRLIRMPLAVQVNLGCVSSVAEILQIFGDGKQDTRFDDPTRALVAASRGCAMTSLLFKQAMDPKQSSLELQLNFCNYPT